MGRKLTLIFCVILIPVGIAIGGIDQLWDISVTVHNRFIEGYSALVVVFIVNTNGFIQIIATAIQISAYQPSANNLRIFSFSASPTSPVAPR